MFYWTREGETRQVAAAAMVAMPGRSSPLADVEPPTNLFRGWIDSGSTVQQLYSRTEKGARFARLSQDDALAPKVGSLALMIRRLEEDDAEAYVDLRREALADSPLAFASSPGDDVASTPEAVRQQLRRAPDSVIIGAFRQALVGAVGLYRDQHLKSAHKAHLWGMYVVPTHRRQGMASKLLDAVLLHARALPGVSWVHLSVSSAAPEAQRLYERVGFRVWGTEPEALRHDGQTVAEHHMALHLKSDDA